MTKSDQELMNFVVEFKEYDRLRRDYYQSSKLTSEFNLDRFRELDSKYAPLDVVGMLLDAFDSRQAQVDQLRAEVDEWRRRFQAEQALAEVEQLRASMRSWEVAKEIEIYAQSDKEWNSLLEERDRFKAMCEKLAAALEWYEKASCAERGADGNLAGKILAEYRAMIGTNKQKE